MKIFSSAPAIITFITSVGTLVSVFYNYAYFLVIDVKLFSAMNIRDHVVSFLEIGIILIVFGFFATIFSRIFSDIKIGDPDIFAGFADKENNKAYVFIEPHWTILLFNFIIFIILFLFGKFYYLFGSLLFSLVWMKIFSFISRRDTQWFLNESAPLYFYLPSVLVFSLAIGAESGNFDMIRASAEYRIKIIEQDDTLSVNVLRYLGNGIIVRNPTTSEIHFINWGVVEKVTGEKSFEATNYICQWFGYCGDAKPENSHSASGS